MVKWTSLEIAEKYFDEDLFDNWNEKNIKILQDHIREHRLKFGGDYHQYGQLGIPVIVNDEGCVVDVIFASFRIWADIMGECYNDEEPEVWFYMDLNIPKKDIKYPIECDRWAEK